MTFSRLPWFSGRRILVTSRLKVIIIMDILFHLTRIVIIMIIYS